MRKFLYRSKIVMQVHEIIYCYKLQCKNINSVGSYIYMYTIDDYIF